MCKDNAHLDLQMMIGFSWDIPRATPQLLITSCFSLNESEQGVSPGIFFTSHSQSWPDSRRAIYSQMDIVRSQDSMGRCTKLLSSRNLGVAFTFGVADCRGLL